MQEIRAAFFVEAEELLEALQDGLATVEAGEADDETINVLFRAVHSIKGGAGAFHLDQLVEFAHIFETALDAVRSGEAELDTTSAKLHYQAADLLADLVRAAQEGDEVDPGRLAPVIDALEEIGGQDDGEAATFEPAPLAVELDLDSAFGPDVEPEAMPVAPSPQAGWRLRVAPTPELYASGNEPLFLFRALLDLGGVDVVCAQADLPPLDAYDPEACLLSWEITLLTEEPRSAVDEIFEFVEATAEITVEPLAVAADGPEGPADQAMQTEPAPADAPPSADQAADVVAPAEAAQAEATQPTVSGARVDAAAAPKAAGPKSPAKATGSGSGAATVRVELGRIDRLVNLVGELVINQAMLSQAVDRPNLPANSPVASELDSFLQLTRDIQDSVMMIRAQLVKPLFQRMGRIVREVASATGKDVRFVTEGEGTEIDKTVIERLADPLTHMIRNAVDHGLETPEARLAAGKPPQGEVRLLAAHRSGRVVMELSDDGAGINRPRVFETAVKRGLIPADVELSDGEIDNLLFLPGFSTASSVSNLSGRGVGMDVVRSAIVALGGRVAIASTPGRGTTFSISLPLTLALMDGMIVRVENELLVLPLSAIIETTSVAPDAVRVLGGSSRVLNLRDRVAPLIDLGVALGYRQDHSDYSDRVAILIGDEGENATPTALVVDQIEEQRQVVIKGLESSLTETEGVAAATILGDGRIALILDPVALLAGREKQRLRARAKLTEAVPS